MKSEPSQRVQHSACQGRDLAYVDGLVALYFCVLIAQADDLHAITLYQLASCFAESDDILRVWQTFVTAARARLVESPFGHQRFLRLRLRQFEPDGLRFVHALDNTNR